MVHLVTPIENECSNEWQRMKMSGAASDEERQRVKKMSMSDSEWYNEYGKIDLFYVSKETKDWSSSWIILFNFLCNI